MDSKLTQRARVAEDLLSEIREGRTRVGEKLPSERKLAERYGVSRPVVREALGMLSMLDVIEIQMGRGAFVTNADVPVGGDTEHSLIDVVDAREAIEAGALRLAAVRAGAAERGGVAAAINALERAVAQGDETTDLDLAFHRSIVSASHSRMLVKLWDEMTLEIARTVRISPHGRAMSASIFVDHQKLANGILTGDLDGALAAAHTLYDQHREFLRNLLG
jgi:DNA-binding FadR family transcriptional regulator